MFFPLPLLAYLAFDGYREERRPILGSIVTFLAGCGFAAFTEWVQTRLPYRTGYFADFKADLIALAASTLIVLTVILVKHQK